MGKAILDDTWAFGSDDETLFRLMKGQIPQQTMPKTWATVPDDQIWKVIAHVRARMNLTRADLPAYAASKFDLEEWKCSGGVHGGSERSGRNRYT